MIFANPDARVLVPDEQPLTTALPRVTHLAIGAHQDDLEIMAYPGLEAGGCFGGIVCTDGSGSSRTGNYAVFSDAEMRTRRAQEQETAAHLGGYGALIQLAHSSATARDPAFSVLTSDLAQIFIYARPQVLYTHNPADKHPTHVAVFRAVLTALRALPMSERPAQLLGCEIWRGLDWLNDADKVRLPIRDLAAMEKLLATFDSQIAGGKRYDLAAPGRARANAVFDNARAADAAPGQWFALDCTPLLRDDALDPVAFLAAHLERFKTSALEQLRTAFAR